MKKLALAIVLLSVLAAAAQAQLPSGNVFFGYSYAHSTLPAPALLPDQSGIVSSGNAGLNGWNASLQGKFLPLIGVVADFSGHYGSQGVTTVCGFVSGCVPTRVNMNATVYHFLLGPEISVSIGKVRPFAHALFGAGHLRESAAGPFNASDTAFADALGGGIDYRLLGPLRWRLQADFLQDRFFSGTQQNFRFSTGPVLHF